MTSTTPRRISKIFLRILIATFLLTSLIISVKAQDIQTRLKPVRNEKYRYGYVDSVTQELVIKYKYSIASRFYKGLAVVRADDQYSVINTKGKAISPYKTKKIEVFKDPDLFVLDDPKTGYSMVYDFSFKKVLPARFSDFKRMGDMFIGCNYDNPASKKLYGIYNKKLETIYPIELEKEPEIVSDAYFINSVKGKEGLIKTNGEIVFPFSYKYVSLYKNEDRIVVIDLNGNCQFYNFEGKKVSDLKFEDFSSPVSGFFPVKVNNKWGFFRNGLVVPCLYDRGYDIDYKNGFFILTKNGKSGMTDSTGTEVIPYIYDKISRYNSNLFAVESKGKSGLINKQGKTILPVNLDEIPKQQANGYFIFSDSRQKFGCISGDGSQVVPFILDEEYVKTNYKEASVSLKKIIEVSPDHPWILYLDALGYYTVHGPQKALPYISKYTARFKTAIEEPHPLMSLQARIHIDLDDYKSAKDDLTWAVSSVWGSKAYIYAGDRKLSQGDLLGADECYRYAGIYTNTEEADAKRVPVVAELKKRGLYKELSFGVKKENKYVPDLRVTIKNFTAEDRLESIGNYQFKMLYSYNEAVSGCPNGYRMPALKDWTGLIEFILKDKRDNTAAHQVIYDIGLGWSRTYNTKQGISYKNTTFKSEDTYGLGISPLRNHNYIDRLSEYQKGSNVITYWFEPGYYNGKEVNLITFTDEGFEFSYSTDAKACVRYIKK